MWLIFAYSFRFTWSSLHNFFGTSVLQMIETFIESIKIIKTRKALINISAKLTTSSTAKKEYYRLQKQSENSRK